MMRYPDFEDIDIIHDELIGITGGEPGYRDRGAVESAVGQPQATFGGKDLYSTIEVKAASLCYSLAMNHGFTDGNKRVAHAATEMFLRMNGFMLTGDVEEHERVMFQLASSQMAKDELLGWLRSHIAVR